MWSPVNHHGNNAALPAFLDRADDFLARRVDHADEADKRQAALELERIGIRVARVFPICRAENAERLERHRLDDGENFRPVRLSD